MEIKGQTFVCGDIHGNNGGLMAIIEENELTDCNIIVLGDCGIGFYNANKKFQVDKFYKVYDMFNEHLKPYNVTLYMIRGNHDNTLYWKDDKVRERWNVNHSNIKLVKDFETLDINNKKYLVIGGSISVDRRFRTPNISYWHDEMVDYEKFTNLDLNGYEGILSHVGPKPANCWKNDNNANFQSFLAVDQLLKDDLAEEQKFINQLLDNNKQLKKWYYGHYHLNSLMKVNETDCKCLDIETIDELK